MENFSRTLNVQMTLLVYLAVGMYCMKMGPIDRETKKKLVDVILKITLSYMIFNSFSKPLTPEVLIQTALILMMTIAISILSFLLERVIYNKYPQKKKSILQYRILANNSGFLGIPMVPAVYGSDGLFAAPVFIIPNRIFMWTAGLTTFTVTDFGIKRRNVFLDPCIVIIFLGIVRRITGFPVPGFLDEAVTDIRAVTTPLSMMVVGTIPIGIPWKKLLEPSISYLVLVRLITLPLVALFMLNLVHAESMLTSVSSILTDVPTGGASALLAIKYGADEDYVSRCIVTTTTVSLTTMLALMLLL